MDTKKLDLNLLLALDALLAEQNVTRAAARLHISQPALSAQLVRLRELFGDQLLMPAQRGMTPTALADELREPLRQSLDQVKQVLAVHEQFNPLKARLTLSIAASDYQQYAVLMPFVLHLREQAPGIRIAFLRIDGRTLAQQMEAGEVDLGLMTTQSAPPNLRSRHLYDERFVCIVRKNHPKVRRQMTFELFASLEHILVSPRGGGFTGVTDDALAALGKKRKVTVSASSFLWVPEMVERSDMMAIVPHRLVKDRTEHLQILEPPIEVAPFTVGMLWHERTHAHRAHRWIRDELHRLCSGL